MRPHFSHTRIANGRYPASGCVNPSVKVLATILRKELWKGAPISCTSCLPNLSISVRSCPPHMGHALPCIAALSASKTSRCLSSVMGKNSIRWRTSRVVAFRAQFPAPVRLDHYVPFSLTFQPRLKDMETAKAVGPALAGKTRGSDPSRPPARQSTFSSSTRRSRGLPATNDRTRSVSLPRGARCVNALS